MFHPLIAKGPERPKRMKVRSILGDETVFGL